jgi:hypothetical protein
MQRSGFPQKRKIGTIQEHGFAHDMRCCQTTLSADVLNPLKSTSKAKPEGIRFHLMMGWVIFEMVGGDALMNAKNVQNQLVKKISGL